MYWLSIGIALLVAAAIIVIGSMYLVDPRAAAPSFGLPLPEPGTGTTWWLRLKGTRDIVSGLVLLAVLIGGRMQLAGLVLLVQAMIPAGDMLLVLAAKGSKRRALGIHGATAALMLLGAAGAWMGAGPWAKG